MQAKRDEQASGHRVTAPENLAVATAHSENSASELALSAVTAEEARQFFEMSADIMCIMGLDGRFRRLNPAFHTILGHAAADTATRPFIDFIHPEDARDSHQHFDELRRQGIPVEFECRYRTVQGDYRWLAWSLRPSGHDEAVFAMARDVTEHKRTQAESVERESRIRFLCQVTAQSNADFIASLAEVLDFSAAMLEADFAMLGRIEDGEYVVEVCAGSGVYLSAGHRLPLEETYCQCVFDSFELQVIHDVPASPLGRAHAHKVMRLGSYIGIPLVVGGKFYGTLAFYGQVRSEPFVESDLDFVQLIARWVTASLDRRTIEAQLEHQRRELDSLVDAVPDALVFADTDRRIRLVNAAFTRLFGYTLDEVQGHTTAMIYPSFAEYVAKGSPSCASETTRDRTATDPVKPMYTQRYERSDGTVFPSETVASVVHGDDGRPLGYVGVIRDISEQQRWRSELELKARALERTNEELERFVYVASHDLKAPVRAVGQLVAWIEEDADGELNAEVRSHLAKITQRITRMEALLTGLLEYARAGINQDIELVDMRLLLDDIVSMLTTAHDCDIVITGAMPLVVTSRIAMEQIFTNLISNAIEHHDACDGQLPHVELMAHQDGTGWQFVIEDDGPGIAEQDRAGVFEIFKTLQPRDVFESSGVGLAIVRKVIDSLGGRLSLTESSKGRGCRFRVWLPGLEGARSDFSESADAA